MMRALFLGLALVFAAPPAPGQEAPRMAPRPLASAFEAMRNGRWEAAASLAARAGPAAADLIEWYRLRTGLGDIRDIMDFLGRNAHWPGLDQLRRNSEETIAGADFDTVLAFYETHAPQTGTGVLNLARAQIARGRVGEAEAGLVLAWRTLDLTTAEHDAFLDAHGELLAPHHAARLDMALWRGLRDVAQMLPLVSEPLRQLAEARRMVAADHSGADERVAALPDPAKADPALAHALFDRHIRRGETDRAIALILRQSRLPGGLGLPERWAGWRRYLARAQMRDGNAETAYELAAFHHLTEGANFADLEWLSGYIALRHLGLPELALDHFQRFRAAVETPISMGRAGYWMGRALEAAGDTQAAQDAYRKGAQHQTSFYGLLAAEKAGVAFMQVPAGPLSGPDWRSAGFAQSDLLKIAILARANGQTALAERFLMKLSETQDAGSLALMGAMLDDLNEPHLQVMLGKAAAQRGLQVPGPYYALHPLAEGDLAVPAELALAIARRESEFDPNVVSGAGARGLMQVMPGTAQEVARSLGLAHSDDRLLRDWQYNARLGAAYLAGLAQRFDGNIVMISAGYNAGPGRPLRWMEARGDPRSGAVDVIDWIEHIPFRETRNYVMRVAESLPIYRARLGRPPLPVPFSVELTGDTIRPLLE